MSPNPTLEQISTEILALRAAIRALTRVQGRRSPSAMTELVQALCEETGRLGEALQSFDEAGRQRTANASRQVAEWIGELEEESRAA